MTIEREDVTRMKELAKASLQTPPKELHHLERVFLNDMIRKYGKTEAMRLLTKVWELSARLKANRAEEEAW